MRKAIGAFICISALSFIIWLVFTLQFISWDFRSNLWATAYLLWHGQSPYDVAALFPGSGALWFPQVIVVFAPLGLLPLYPATNLWLIMNVALLVALIWYLGWQASQDKPKPLLFLVLLLAAALFPPTGSHLLLGQVDLVVMTAIVGGTIALERDRVALGGLLYAVALSKPQLCLIVLPSVLAYLLFTRREPRKALQLLSITCILAVALTLPMWIGYPNWVKDFVLNYQHNPHYFQPSLFSWLPMELGWPGYAVWLVLLVATLAISVRLWSRFEPTRAVLWSLALTTLISPYIWVWDFILVLPLLIDTAARLANVPARVTLFGFLVLCLVFTLLSVHSIAAGEYVLWWIPYEMITGIVISLELGKDSAKSGFRDSVPAAGGR